MRVRYNATYVQHEPTNYSCPFCKIVQGGEDSYSNQNDVVFRSDSVTAFISPQWWHTNPGHVLVVPNDHYENIYDIPDKSLASVYITVKQVALAMKEKYKCDGVSTRQHNEPAGDQTLWHLHVHVSPRHPNDNLYLNHRNVQFVDEAYRAKFAHMLRDYFEKH